MTHEITAQFASGLTRDQVNDLPLFFLCAVITDAEYRIVIIASKSIVGAVADSGNVNNIGLTSRGCDVCPTSQRTLASLNRKSLRLEIGVNVRLTVLESCLRNRLKVGVNSEHSKVHLQRRSPSATSSLTSHLSWPPRNVLN